MQQFARDAVRRFRRRVAQRDLAEAEPGARQLAVIGGGIAGSGLVLSAHLLELAGRLGGAAAPVGGTGTDDRIGRAFIDVREMLQRGGRIVEKAQRDPAGHEVEFGTVIGIGRRRRLAHHPIRGLRVAEVDEPAGQHADARATIHRCPDVADPRREAASTNVAAAANSLCRTSQ